MHIQNTDFKDTPSRSRKLGIMDLATHPRAGDAHFLNSVIQKHTGYNKLLLSAEEKEVIYGVVKNNPHLLAWQILISLDPEESHIDAYIETFINEKKDFQKLQYLKFAFCHRLYNSIIEHWSCCERKTLVHLLLTIDHYKIDPTYIPTKIINSILKIRWSFNHLYIIQSIIDSPDIRQLALARFSFLTSSPKSQLLALLSHEAPSDHLLHTLRNNFRKEHPRINAYELIAIYQNMSEFGIIRDKKELLELLKNRTLNEEESRFLESVPVVS